MSELVQTPLTGFSDALAERTRLARPLVAAITVPGHRTRSGTLWRKDVIVASEQTFPDVGEAGVRLDDGSGLAARVAGRDRGTNIVALKLEGTPDPASVTAAEPHPGALVLALGADEDGIAVRLGIVHSVGPAWHSRAGGRIDRRITLDLALASREEGGPVLDAAGGLLGMSTLGPRRRVLVIPKATIDGVLEPLLSKGQVERGWLGLALQPVLVPEALQSQVHGPRGVMIMGLARGGPAAQAGLHVGDILVSIAGQSVTSPASVAQRLGPEAVGHQVELRLIRAGNVISVHANVGIRPSQ
jgi:S1-C subfamily serine protease